MEMKTLSLGILNTRFVQSSGEFQNQHSGSTVGQSAVSCSIKGNVKRYISPLELKARNK